MLRQFLILCSAGMASTAAAHCEAPTAAHCAEGYVFDSEATQDFLEPWLSFNVVPDAVPLSYDAPRPDNYFTMEEGLFFELPATAADPVAVRRNDAVEVTRDSEPAFALLFGSVARLHADGSMALGRGEKRSNSPENYDPRYWGDLLPAAFYTWNDRLDVDLGLSYLGTKRFSTSVGFAEKIGEQNNDPAVVGWFEYRF